MEAQVELKHKSRMINTKGVAQYLGMSPGRFYNIQHLFPFKRKKIGPCKLWDLKEIDEYLDTLEATE